MLARRSMEWCLERAAADAVECMAAGEVVHWRARASLPTVAACVFFEVYQKADRSRQAQTLAARYWDRGLSGHLGVDLTSLLGHRFSHMLTSHWTV